VIGEEEILKGKRELLIMGLFRAGVNAEENQSARVSDSDYFDYRKMFLKE
jgi:hypothetical protein